MSHPGPLVVIPALRAYLAGDGRVGVTRKFVEGMAQYRELWGGEVVAVMHPVHGADPSNLDSDWTAPEELPFRLVLQDFADPGFDAHLQGAAVVLGGPHHMLHGLAARCRRLGVPAVYNTEYSLLTRLQIARADGLSPLRLARRCAWEIEQELRVRHELGSAAGLQCNGTPTYDALRRRCPNTLLYFDSRIGEEDLVSEADHRRAQERRARGRPLQLAFSGRFTPMKGVDGLAAVAAELRRLDVEFTFHLCGGGERYEPVRREVERLGLARYVQFHGTLDFKTELIPLLVDQIDLFVCPHVQGDPSCTYVETFACGVPIVGYDNQAFAGLLRMAPEVGWATPMRKPVALAARIHDLDRRRDRLCAAGDAARTLAHEHSFERTFARRIEHLRGCARTSR